MVVVHLILQGKGGVGKSMVSAFLYQGLKALGKEVAAFDTDPVNSTLAGFREFNVSRIDILKDGKIDRRSFDPLIEAIVGLPDDTHAIVDNGASSFLELKDYFVKDGVLALLEEAGCQVYLHSVVTGGQAITDTVSGLKTLATDLPSAPIVVWLNSFFGDIEMDGKPFEQFKVYKEHAEQFHAIINIPQGNRDTTGKDLEILFAKRQSFDAGINSSQSIVMRARLNRYWKELLGLIQNAGIA